MSRSPATDFARRTVRSVQVDAMTVPQPLDKIGELARRVQTAGFSGLLFTETGRTAYLNAAVASQAAPGLELSTGVAVAFPRSPFVTAATAWELQEATGGRFRLGLGTQVRTHVVRRYGDGVRASGPAAAGLRAGGEGVLRGVPDGEAGPPRRVLRLGLHHAAVECGADRRAGSEGRHRGGEPVDAADGGRGGRRGARASAGRAGLHRAACGAECGCGSGEVGTVSVGDRGDRAGDDDRRRQRRGAAQGARDRARAA